MSRSRQRATEQPPFPLTFPRWPEYPSIECESLLSLKIALFDHPDPPQPDPNAMTTSSGEEGWCGPCGHLLNEHTAPRYSKCKKCKAAFTVCQVGSHGAFSEDGDSEGRRICHVPCYCGVDYYPSSAREVRRLQSHEYPPDHPGYWPRGGDQEDSSTADYADFSTVSSGAIHHSTPTPTMPAIPEAVSPVPTAAATTAGEYTTTGGVALTPETSTTPAYTMSTTVSYATPSYTAYTIASYTTTASAIAAPYTTGAYTASTYITPARAPGHAQQLSEEPEDPLAAIDRAAGTTGGSTRQTQARHVRFGSHGSDDPLGMDEPQQMSALADAFAQVDIGGSAAQQQQPAAEAEPLLVGTHVKKDTVRFEHAGRKFKTRPDQWLQLSTAEGAVYLQFTDPSSGQLYWTWAFGLTLEGQGQLAGYQGLGNQTSGSGEKGDKKGKGKATKGGRGNPRKK